MQRVDGADANGAASGEAGRGESRNRANGTRAKGAVHGDPKLRNESFSRVERKGAGRQSLFEIDSHAGMLIQRSEHMAAQEIELVDTMPQRSAAISAADTLRRVSAVSYCIPVLDDL